MTLISTSHQTKIVIQRYNEREKKWKDNEWIAREQGVDTPAKALEWLKDYYKSFDDWEAMTPNWIKEGHMTAAQVKAYLKRNKHKFRAIQRTIHITDEEITSV